MWQLELSYSWQENIRWCSCFGKLTFFSKTNRSTTPKYTPKKTENISNKDLYMNVHSDIIIAKK